MEHIRNGTFISDSYYLCEVTILCLNFLTWKPFDVIKDSTPVFETQSLLLDICNSNITQITFF